MRALRGRPGFDTSHAGNVSRLAGGLSHASWIVDLEGARVDRVVVKAEPAYGPLQPYDISREASVQHALHEQSFPVAPVILVGDESLMGRTCMVMEFVSGDVPSLSQVTSWSKWQDLDQRLTMGAEMINTLAKLQQIDVSCFPFPEYKVTTEVVRERISKAFAKIDLELFGRLGAQHPVVTDAARWLIERTPSLSPAEAVWLHGDFRIGNVIFAENLEISAVLDWERAAIGDPMADLGFLCLPMGNARTPDLMGAVLQRTQLFELYEQFAGTRVDESRVDYYTIYALYMEAVAIGCGLSLTVKDPADMRYVFTAKLFAEVTWLLADRMVAYDQTYGG